MWCCGLWRCLLLWGWRGCVESSNELVLWLVGSVRCWVPLVKLFIWQRWMAAKPSFQASSNSKSAYSFVNYSSDDLATSISVQGDENAVQMALPVLGNSVVCCLHSFWNYTRLSLSLLPESLHACCMSQCCINFGFCDGPTCVKCQRWANRALILI